MNVRPSIKWKEFGKNVKILIESFDGSLSAFSRSTGISKSIASRAQTGKRLQTEYFLWMCSVCNLNPMDYFVETGKRFKR
jgi:hypothetical protein